MALTEQQFSDHVAESVRSFGRRRVTDEGWSGFGPLLSYARSDASDISALRRSVDDAAAALGGSPRLLHHLSIPPAAFSAVVTALGSFGLCGPESRIIVEKPFGSDLVTARQLNAPLHEVFDESQVLRIDHFLGKEDVQNIRVARFANGLFEPIWNRHVDHVQIDVPETLGLEGRARFYEGVGAYRDMVVTHVLQALGFVAMERLAAFTADALSVAKEQVSEALQPIDPARVVRGQYRATAASRG